MFLQDFNAVAGMLDGLFFRDSGIAGVGICYAEERRYIARIDNGRRLGPVFVIVKAGSEKDAVDELAAMARSVAMSCDNNEG